MKERGSWFATPVRYIPDRQKVEQLTRLRQEEKARMAEYAESRQCLMQFLAAELEDPEPAPCGRCAVCRGGPLIPKTVPARLTQQAVQLLRRSSQNIEPRKQWEGDALTSLQPTGRILTEHLVEPGRAPCMWGDAGWGELVRQGKVKLGRFDESLVDAAADMVVNDWKPAQFPAWAACVPSARHPHLVPDFAQRLAARLQLPFRCCLRKKGEMEPQKRMQNSYQ